MKEISLECYGNAWENHSVSIGCVALEEHPGRDCGIWVLELQGGVNQENGMGLEMVVVGRGKNVKRKEQAVGKKDYFYKRNLARLDHSIEGWLWGKMI